MVIIVNISPFCTWRGAVTSLEALRMCAARLCLSQAVVLISLMASTAVCSAGDAIWGNWGTWDLFIPVLHGPLAVPLQQLSPFFLSCTR